MLMHHHHHHEGQKLCCGQTSVSLVSRQAIKIREGAVNVHHRWKFFLIIYFLWLSMCAHRSWAHLASDSFSTDENSKEENGGGDIGHIHHEVILYSRITSQAHLEHGS